jgi:hypothetical protein
MSESRVHANLLRVGVDCERFPSLVREGRARGHEIASHEYSHLLAYEVGLPAFLSDANSPKSVLGISSVLRAAITECPIGTRSWWCRLLAAIEAEFGLPLIITNRLPDLARRDSLYRRRSRFQARGDKHSQSGHCDSKNVRHASRRHIDCQHLTHRIPRRPTWCKQGQ